ncbi:UNVERIFIED_CONTAM: hypothetical protein K2H54_037126 [Gekko kuhli]
MIVIVHLKYFCPASFSVKQLTVHMNKKYRRKNSINKSNLKQHHVKKWESLKKEKKKKASIKSGKSKTIENTLQGKGSEKLVRIKTYSHAYVWASELERLLLRRLCFQCPPT